MDRKDIFCEIVKCEYDKKFIDIKRIIMNSKEVEKDDLFVAIRGGNKFAGEALEKGAYVVYDDKELQIEEKFKEKAFYVKNSVEFLQEFAEKWRKNLNLKVIGITGSNGKTTVKDMIYHLLSVKYKGKSISDVLDMTVEEAHRFFINVPSIAKKLDLLKKVGLDYIQLGQSSLELSGGEAQRIKLSKELSSRGTGKTLYILDEPTTGLHFEDIKMLLSVLQELVNAGNTVIVIEHNLEVIKVADHIIDMGPFGGSAGGQVIATGTPEEIAENKDSLTGKYLKKYLK